MAVAGFCRSCQQYVWLDDAWGCRNGHPWTEISNWYDPETGAQITPHWLQQAPPAAGPASRLDLLAGILQLLGQYPGYRAQYGTDTDIVIDNTVADASWTTGKKKVTYEAILKAVEPERTVYFWEALKESGGGLSFGGLESESYSTSGTKRSGSKSQTILGPDGVAADYTWDYGATRRLIENTVTAAGWSMRTVLRKGSARW